jgi:hypothetical protein
MKARSGSMAEVPIIVYLVLLGLVIISLPMAQIAKYGWKSRFWTAFFAVVGSLSVLTLIIILI